MKKRVERLEWIKWEIRKKNTNTWKQLHIHTHAHTHIYTHTHNGIIVITAITSLTCTSPSTAVSVISGAMCVRAYSIKSFKNAYKKEKILWDKKSFCHVNMVCFFCLYYHIW